VSEWKFKETEVTLDKGRNDGVLAGMEFHVIQPDSLFETITVRSVDEQTAEGIMTQIGEDEAGPRVGWKLSTKLVPMRGRRSVAAPRADPRADGLNRPGGGRDR
jgi:hypothetical protein